MKIGIINSKHFILIGLITIVGCNKFCKTNITVYEGMYFLKGQKVELIIDEEIIFEKNFKEDRMRNDAKKLQDFCCERDSCLVKLKVGAKDTTFFISPRRTKRLYFGSDIYGNFSVATDENPDAWIKI